MDEKTQFRAGTEEMGTPKGDRSIIPASSIKEIVERLQGLADLDEEHASGYLGKTGHEALLAQSLQAGAKFYRQAASLIESLSERVGELERERQKLRGALKPLDAAYDIWVGHPDDMPLKIARIGPGDDADLTMADLCEARALSKQGEG